MIYHIVVQSEWSLQANHDLYFPADFNSVGFIHCCTYSQLKGVLQRYFQDRSDLLLLSIDEHMLDAELKYEPGLNGELFPHLYGPINSKSIVKVELIR
ncbi:MAG: DUF952 domain-containing protein [Cyclobacteriaceae bacterium]|nr:MAG: DUF952 domain-containing protein [Cyclobacteriaceae bacterium]HNT51071.1 DUF952 domain-containing protein [Cyclobacteriaceae bacterium]